MDKEQIWCNFGNMKDIFKLKLVIFCVELRITYVLDRKILTITYWDLFLALIRDLRAEVIGIGCDVVRSTWVS